MKNSSLASKKEDMGEYFYDKEVLITGGLGFIGSTLAHRLVELGSKVFIVDSLIPGYGGNMFNCSDIESKVKIDIVNIRNERVMNELVKGKDFIFHLAGSLSHIDSIKDPYNDLEINCRGSLSVLESCRKYSPNARIIFSGSRSQYGKPQYLPVDEKHPMNPLDINGINNIAAEYYHLLYNRIYGIPVVSLRLTNTYGPRHHMKHHRQGIINWFIRMIIDDQEVKLFGDGAQVRDLNYIDDVVEAFILSAISQRAVGQVYNLGGSHVSLLELVKTIISIAGKGSYKLVDFPQDLRKIEIGDYIADFSKIKKELNWQPKVSLEEGLKKTIEFYTINKRYYW